MLQYSPSEEFLFYLRLFNTVVGFVAFFCLLVFLAKPRWREWNVPTRLGFMSLTMLTLTGSYASLEVALGMTEFRVPMITVSLIWTLVAALWPREDTSRRPRED